jgi:hypothetical protein
LIPFNLHLGFDADRANPFSYLEKTGVFTDIPTDPTEDRDHNPEHSKQTQGTKWLALCGVITAAGD